MSTEPNGELLHGKTALITGGAQGIGLAVARAFVRQGARVTVADVAADRLASAATELEAIAPGRIHAVTLDVTDDAATGRAVEDTIGRFGGLDCAVANAGILALKHGVDMSAAEFRRVLDVNLTGAFITATVAARAMIASGRAAGSS